MKIVSIATLVLMLAMVGFAQAASPTATLTPTATATGTPVPNCVRSVGGFCVPLAAPSAAGQVLTSDANAWNGDMRAPIWSNVPTPTSTATPAISGGGALSTGSNIRGSVTSAAATGNVITLPSIGCANAMLVTLTAPHLAWQTASSTTSATFSATASDTVNYSAGCE